MTFAKGTGVAPEKSRVNLKQLAADVRQVWTPPGGRAWSKADVRIEKLLQAIEADDEASLREAARRALPLVARIAECSPEDYTRLPQADLDEAARVLSLLRAEDLA